MKPSRLACAVAAFVVTAACPVLAPASEDSTVGHVYLIEAQTGSGEYGTFALKPRGTRTTIEVHLIGAPAGVVQPAHIHLGTCAKLDPAPLYPLKSLKDGISETSLDVPIATLMSKGVAVDVRKSATALGTSVACGNIMP